MASAQTRVNDLQSAIDAGGTLTEAQSGVKSAVEGKFGEGSATSENLGKISAILGKIHDAIGAKGSGANVVFSPANGTAHMGAVEATNTIHVYPGFNPDSNLNTYYVSHESGHLAGLRDQELPSGLGPRIGRTVTANGTTKTNAYGNSGAWWLARNDPAKAALNNDNYQCFALQGRC